MSLESRARYTSPIPPAPMAPTISKGTKRVPLGSNMSCLELADFATAGVEIHFRTAFVYLGRFHRRGAPEGGRMKAVVCAAAMVLAATTTFAQADKAMPAKPMTKSAVADKLMANEKSCSTPSRPRT